MEIIIESIVAVGLVSYIVVLSLANRDLRHKVGALQIINREIRRVQR